MRNRLLKTTQMEVALVAAGACGRYDAGLASDVVSMWRRRPMMKPVLLVEAAVLALYGLFYLGAAFLGGPLADLIHAGDPQASSGMGIALLALAAVAMQIALPTPNAENSRWRYKLSWVYVFLPLAFLVSIVLQSVSVGMQGESWFWWITALSCAAFGIALAIARYRVVQPAKGQDDPDPKMPELTRPAASTDPNPARMNYAWEWFKYHADQRLKAFNYYLIIVGILALAYSTALKEGLNSQTAQHSWRDFAVVIAICGCIISIAFLMIEIRNRELVDSGGRWLDELEDKALGGMTIRKWSNDPGERPHLRKAIGWVAGILPDWKSGVTHTLWLRAVYLLAMAGFVLAIALAFRAL
jgi:hypothetical protein